MSNKDKTHARMFYLIFINCKAYDKVVTIISLVYYFIMDGKPTIKIMNRIELLTSLKLTNSESESKSMIKKKFNSKKRGSIPLVSTSISVKKNNNPKPNTLRKFQNNFMTSKTHLNAVTSCKRIFQSHTAMAKPLVKKEDPLQKTQCQKLLCKNSDKIQKLLWNEPEENLPPLILSANFIMDEDDFWSAPKINPSINKCWKQIHKNYYVIWIVKSQRNFKKIKQYSDQFELPLNAAYYHKKQLKYTVDYSPLRRQLIKFYGSDLKEIKAIENLKLNTKDLCQFRTFTGKIPIMFDSRLSVYYIRSEESGHGLELVSDICRSSNSIKKRITVQLKSVKNFVEEHYTNLQIEKEQKSKGDLTRASTLEQKLETQWVDQQLTQREVESFKKQLIDQIIRQKGRNFQYEGFSVHYFVGDIIKRNYQLLQQSAGRRLEPKFYNHTNKNAKILKMGQNNRDLGIVQRFYQYYA